MQAHDDDIDTFLDLPSCKYVIIYNKRGYFPFIWFIANPRRPFTGCIYYGISYIYRALISCQTGRFLLSKSCREAV